MTATRPAARCQAWAGSGRGSSGSEGVPVLAAVKPGRSGAVGGRVDRGCAPAGLGWSWRNPAVRGRRPVTGPVPAGRGRPG